MPLSSRLTARSDTGLLDGSCRALDPFSTPDESRHSLRNTGWNFAERARFVAGVKRSPLIENSPGKILHPTTLPNTLTAS